MFSALFLFIDKYAREGSCCDLRASISGDTGGDIAAREPQYGAVGGRMEVSAGGYEKRPRGVCFPKPLLFILKLKSHGSVLSGAFGARLPHARLPVVIRAHSSGRT